MSRRRLRRRREGASGGCTPRKVREKCIKFGESMGNMQGRDVRNGVEYSLADQTARFKRAKDEKRAAALTLRVAGLSRTVRELGRENAGWDAIVFNFTSTCLGRPSPGLRNSRRLPCAEHGSVKKFQPI